MKKIIISIVSIAIVGLIVFKLYANKQEMKENARLSEVTTDAIPVQVTQMELKELLSEVKADGIIQANSDLSILSETQGKVIKIYKEKGDKVVKGELLAKVESDLLEAQFEAVKANYEKFKADKNRFETLLKEEAVTVRQMEDIRIGLSNAEAQYKQVKKQLENTEIRATTSGTIHADYIQEGSFISGGMKLYDIVDVSVLYINVKLSDVEVLQVSVGDEISLYSNVYPDKTILGKVTAIDVKSDASLKYGVEIQFKNPSELPLKPGMYATAQFKFSAEGKQFLLDRTALIGSVQNPEVFIVKGDKAELKQIRVGKTYGNQIEVLNGLDAKDQVVYTGQINLRDGIKVNIVK
ncbi:MAG: efflux RND transporter periplasmic adaptor subunit [Bacteroidetes bacterium]|nr:MAG: efflux RND transporter periplasmic adaptor subunit [Bacteroidota bacterium]